MFGDFFGGIIGSIFSFFALLALLVTIHIQAKELNVSNITLNETRKELEESRRVATAQYEHIQRESHRNRLVQTIARYEKEIDAVMARETSLIHPDLSVPHTIADFFSYSSPSDAADHIPENGSRIINRRDRVSIGDLCELILQLNITIREYIQSFQSDAFSFSVCTKYGTAAQRLADKEFIIAAMVDQILNPGYGFDAGPNRGSAAPTGSAGTR